MRMRGPFYAAVLLVVSLALLSGCSRKTERSDAQVATDVQTRIYSDAGIQSRQIDVQAANGVVTLSGDVTSDTERAAAASDAATIEGVRTVVNNLQVQQAQAAPPPAPPVQQPAPAAAKPRTQSTKSTARHHRKASQDESAGNEVDVSKLPPAPPGPPADQQAAAAPAPAPVPPPLLRRRRSRSLRAHSCRCV